MTLALEADSADGAVLAGTVSVAAVSGTATFDAVSIAKAGVGYRVVASSPGIPSLLSDAFDIVPGAPVALRFDSQPSGSVVIATPFPSTTVSVVDAAGNRVTGDTSSISITSTPGTLQGTLTRVASAGMATFNDLSLTETGTGFVLTASKSGLPSASSNPFDVVPGAAASLAFRGTSATLTAGAAASTVEVELRDAQGYVRTNDSTTVVELALASSPTDATITGSASARAVNGVATFSESAFRKAGAYVLSASAEGHAQTTGFALTVNPGALAKFAVTLPASAKPGEKVTVTAKALDAYDNVVTSYSGTATLSSSDPSASVPGSIRFENGEALPFDVVFTGDALATLTLSDGDITGAGETVVSLDVPGPDLGEEPSGSGPLGDIRGGCGCSGTPGAESALYGLALAAAQLVRLRRRPRK